MSLQDETAFLQYGQETETMFYELERPTYHVSAWTDDLIEKPNGKYKFTSMEVNMKLKEKVTMRDTYDVLSFVGDIGGLVDGLMMLGSFLLSPYTSFKLRSYLLSHLYRRLPERVHEGEKADEKNDESAKIGETGKQDVSLAMSINFDRSNKKQIT